jgi:hypothetical protein
LFDVNWYLTTNPEVAEAGVEPLSHYLSTGWKQGLSPHCAFDSPWYLATNQDVSDLGREPLSHYIVIGWKERRCPHPLFDIKWYSSTNGLAVNGDVEPLAHYLNCDVCEDRSAPSPIFDFDFLRDSGYLTPNWKPTDIFRFPPEQPNSLFDPTFYRKNCVNGLPAGMSPVEDFCRKNVSDERAPNPFFSYKLYRKAYGEVSPAEAIGPAAQQTYRSRPMYLDGSVVVADFVMGDDPNPDGDLAIFVHYDPDGEIQDYVIQYLKNLHSESISILFVSGCRQLTTQACSKIKGLVWRVITTRNEAYDWGLYFIGIRALGSSLKGKSILFANDSCVGSLAPLRDFFARARSNDVDIYSATDSDQLIWHLQSYFIWVSGRVTASDEWESYWNQYQPAGDKKYVIIAYELGFSTYFSAAGFKLGAHWPLELLMKTSLEAPKNKWRLEASRGDGGINPTHHFWDVLLDLGCPFLKRELVAKNPCDVPNLDLLLNMMCHPRRDI